MNFKVTKIAAAVAAGLGVSVVGTAQADEVLFPYVVVSNTVTTLVSTINYADPFTAARVSAPDKLHYRYYYKNGDSAEKNDAACTEVDERLPSSANDIVTFDVGQRFATDNLGILFEDVKTSTNVKYGSKTFSLLNITLPVRAFLMVDNNDYRFGTTLSDTADSVAGEAIVLEFQAGAAWGYAAYNAAGVYNAQNGRVNAFDFSDNVETAGEVIAGSAVPVALAPFKKTGGEWITKFFVTPISRTVKNAAGAVVSYGNQAQSNLNARIRLAVQDPGSAIQDVMFDRDELPVSGQVPQNVVCVGAVDATAMLSEGALNRVPSGGWSNVVVSAGTVASATTTNEAVVIKLEYNAASPVQLDKADATAPVNGIVNNAIWLRKGIRESIPVPANRNTPRVALYAAGNDSNSPLPGGAGSGGQ